MADKTKYFDYDTVKEMLYDLEYEGKDVEPSDYPFIEIADEHGDLIDRDALLKQFEHDTSRPTGYEVVTRIMNAPVIVGSTAEGEKK